MKTVRLAYRDHDRTPLIFCIREMARRHYGLDVEVLHIKPSAAFESALFDGTADVIIEHLEYLYEKAASGEKISFLCAPSKGGNLDLVVQRRVSGISDLRGGSLAVRPSGQPHAIMQWLHMMELDKEVSTVYVDDDEVGRWGQWKKVESGSCIAAFMSPLYVPHAVAAGLKVISIPELPIVGHYAQACLASFARSHPALVTDYLKAVVHGVCLMIYRRDEALAIVRGEPMKRMKIDDPKELERQIDAIVRGLKPKPYPMPAAVANTYEIAVEEYPDAAGINPLALWDLHWVKELDDSGFIDGLMQEFGATPVATVQHTA
jgi:hypothetical protein